MSVFTIVTFIQIYASRKKITLQNCFMQMIEQVSAVSKYKFYMEM